MLLEELLKCQAAYESTLFSCHLRALTPFTSLRIIIFLNCIKKKKKAHSSQVYNLNAKFLPRFTFSSSVLNHWKCIEWGVLSGEHCCSPTNRTSVWSSSADIYPLASWGLLRRGRILQACCVPFCLVLLLNLSGKETSVFWKLIL